MKLRQTKLVPETALAGAQVKLHVGCGLAALEVCQRKPANPVPPNPFGVIPQ
jgi:hypothetical protein